MASRPKPSQRPKKRYIVFVVHSKMPLQIEQVSSMIQHECNDLLDKGLRIINDTWDSKTQEGIIRIYHDFKPILLERLTKEFTKGETSFTIKTIGVSGTIRKAKLKFMTNKIIRKENKRNYHHRT